VCAVCAPLHSSSRRWCAGRGGEVAHTAHTAPGPLGASAPTRTAVVGAAVQLLGRFLAQIRPNRLTWDNWSSSSPRFSRFGPTMTAGPPLRRREPGRQVAGGGPSGAPPDRLHVPPRRETGVGCGSATTRRHPLRRRRHLRHNATNRTAVRSPLCRPGGDWRGRGVSPAGCVLLRSSRRPGRAHPHTARPPHRRRCAGWR
jgi:hypothetical protein